MKYLSITILCCCAVLGAEELLVNGNFEQNANAWRYPDYAKKPNPGAIVSDVVYGGQKAYKMGLDGDQGNELYTRFATQPGKAYLLKFMLKSDNLAPDDLTVKILQNDNSKVLGWVANPPGSGVIDLVKTGGTFDWQEFKVYLPADSFAANCNAANLYFMRKNNGGGTLYIDEVSLESVEAKADVAKQQNWLYESWKKIPDPGAFDPTVCRTGGKSYCLGKSTAPGAAAVYQTFDYKADQSISIQFYLKGVNLAANDVNVKVLAFGDKGKVLGWVANPPGSGVIELYRTGGTFDWQEVKLNLTPDMIPAGTVRLFLFVNRNANDQGKLYLDDLQTSYTEGKKTTLNDAGNQPAGTSQNLWPFDGSFETEVGFFLLPRDDKQAFDGKYSLRIDPGKGFRSGYLLRAVAPNKSYVLSCRAKADKAAALGLTVNSQNYMTIARGQWELKDEWQTLSVVIPAQKLATSLQLNFNFPNDATVWLDAMQLSEGTAPQAYSPESPISLGVLASAEPGEIYLANAAAIERVISVRNNQKDKSAVRLTAALEDFYGNTTPLLTQSPELAPGETFSKKITVLKAAKHGYYVIRLTAESNGKTYRASMPFAVVDPAPALGKDSFFGLHPFGPVPPEALKKIGVNTTRNFIHWKYLPYDNGSYQFPENSRKMSESGLFQLECLEVTKVPAKLQNAAGYTDPENYCKFARQALDHLGKAVSYVEIENEPDLSFPTLFKGDIPKAASEYAQVINTIAPLIKKQRPDVKILGCGISGVDFNSNFPFARAVLAAAGKNLDVVAIHPYANARYVSDDRGDIGPEANQVYNKTLAVRKLVDEYNPDIQLWYGEIGWGLDVDADYLSDSSRRFAQYLSRLMILGKAAKVDKIVYFLADFCIEKERYMYGIWRNTVPLPAAMVYSATAQILEGAVMQEAVSTGDIQCYRFTNRDGKPLAALWTSQGVECKAVIPLAAKSVQVRDMLDNPVEVIGQSVTIQLSGSPVYVIGETVSGEEMSQALKNATFDLPPVNCQWQILGEKRVAVTVTNERTSSLNGELAISGASFAETKRALSLAAGQSQKLEFAANDNLNNREITVTVVSNLGKAESKFRAEFYPCPRFTPTAALPAVGHLPLMNNRNYLIPNDPGNSYDGEKNLSIQSAVTYDDTNLYLSIDVTDNVHAPGKVGRLWNGDSIQLVIDTLANAVPNDYSLNKDDYELSFGLTPEGPQKEFDYIYEKGRLQQSLDKVKCDITRTGDLTGYRIAIPWEVLKMKPAPGTVFGLNFIANDDDGFGRNYWMGPTPGIGESKYPYLYKKFILGE